MNGESGIGKSTILTNFDKNERNEADDILMYLAIYWIQYNQIILSY